MLFAGAAKTNITPPLEQSRRTGKAGVATAIIGDFFARAVVVSDGKNKVAIVLLDICDFYDNITRGARDYIGRWTDVPSENVLICATHVHAAPKVIDEDGVVGSDELTENTRAYINVLNRQIASAVYLADKNLKQAQAKIGSKLLKGVGNPSRIRMKNGEIKSLGSTLGIKDIPQEEIESESPIDENLRVLLFEGLEQKPICALSNFGCHNNLCLLGNTLNTDFFGYGMSKIEKELGDDFIMLATPGPQGDVQPLAKLEHRQYDSVDLSRRKTNYKFSMNRRGFMSQRSFLIVKLMEESFWLVQHSGASQKEPPLSLKVERYKWWEKNIVNHFKFMLNLRGR